MSLLHNLSCDRDESRGTLTGTVVGRLDPRWRAADDAQVAADCESEASPVVATPVRRKEPRPSAAEMPAAPSS
jgi:hypothetical protein